MQTNKSVFLFRSKFRVPFLPPSTFLMPSIAVFVLLHPLFVVVRPQCRKDCWIKRGAQADTNFQNY